MSSQRKGKISNSFQNTRKNTICSHSDVDLNVNTNQSILESPEKYVSFLIKYSNLNKDNVNIHNFMLSNHNKIYTLTVNGNDTILTTIKRLFSQINNSLQTETETDLNYQLDIGNINEIKVYYLKKNLKIDNDLPCFDVNARVFDINISSFCLILNESFIQSQIYDKNNDDKNKNKNIKSVIIYNKTCCNCILF